MRLIDADELANKVADLYAEGEEATEADKVVNDVIDLIDNAPTVEITDYDTGYQDGLEDGLNDIRPQGEWIDTGMENEYWAEEYQCSICGAKDHWHNFCPNCGARMETENIKSCSSCAHFNNGNRKPYPCGSCFINSHNMWEADNE